MRTLTKLMILLEVFLKNLTEDLLLIPGFFPSGFNAEQEQMIGKCRLTEIDELKKKSKVFLLFIFLRTDVMTDA